jgi:hypothetical protein
VTDYDTLLRTMCDGTARRTVPRWTADVLGAIVDGRSATTAVRHPLGFVCIPLERVDDRGVCVHVWSDRFPSARPSTSAMHAHSWDLTSYVLYGTVRNEVLAVSESAERCTNRLFEVRSTGATDEIHDTRRLVRCETEAVTLNRLGDTYTLPAGVFHTTVVHGEAATVALGSNHPGAADLSLGGIDTPSHRVHRERCDHAETAHAARVVTQRLAGITTPSDTMLEREARCVSRRS